MFRGKHGGDRVQGNITPAGSIAFEHARRRAAKMAGWEVEEVSDADTIEFMALGEERARKIFESQ
jgi:hypothetical protein